MAEKSRKNLGKIPGASFGWLVQGENSGIKLIQIINIIYILTFS